MSEKMDGVRAYWDGSTFFSRHGNVISSPLWFTSTLPTHVTLDGELWMGHGSTHEAVQKAMHLKSGDSWRQIGYYVFDIPSSPGVYEARMKEMEDLKPLLAHIHIVENIRCTGKQH